MKKMVLKFERCKCALGRIRIPAEFMREMDATIDDLFEIQFCFGKICVSKYNPKTFMIRPFVGIVRGLDSLGRIVIPKEYWDLIEFQGKRKVYLYLERDKMIVEPILE